MLSNLAMTTTNQDPAKLLAHARAHYDNELLKIEQIWAKLAPGDYVKRKKLTKAVTSMIEIDKDIKYWEDKLSTHS